MTDVLRGPALVLGAGAWGTALAVHLAQRAGAGQVSLWARDPALAARLHDDQANAKYLPGVTLPSTLAIASDLGRALVQWREDVARQGTLGLLVFATPVAGLEAIAKAVAQVLGPAARPHEALIWLSKGLSVTPEGPSFYWPDDLVARALPDWPRGALTGPSFAQEVARGLPCALTLASQDAAFAREAARFCHGGAMRVYASGDLIGAQLGGAMKNVLAIAAGVADGLALGANARAALITRGLAEAARLGHALGALPQTFMGLATLGDLVLTATGDLSRNRRVGMALAAGQPLQEILGGLGHVAEGVSTAPAILALARQKKVDLPIVQAVCRLIEGAPVQAVLQALLSRDPVDEDH